MSGIYSTPTQNSIQKQLGSTLSASATTMVLNEDISALLSNVSSDHPCTCVVDRIDSNGALTPTKREYITFTGASGTSLTGLTRNADGSGSDQEHSVGAIVEFVPDVLWAKSLLDSCVDTSTAQTLTNKTLTSPIIPSIYQDAGKTKLMTLPDTASDTLVTLAATQTLTNKTLTTPVINGAITGTITPPLTFYGANFYAPDGFLINGKIVPSVTSNNLTVAIKGKDGNDPSSTNPVYVSIGGTPRAITSALSVTKNAGTNWFNAGSTELATKEIDYFVYLGYNATDGVVIGFSRIPYACEYDDFSAITTNPKYCAISTISNAAAGDDYVNIGRFAATLSAGAGYTWTVPTFTNKNLKQRPCFETRWLDWLPTYGTGYNTVTTYGAKYKLVDNIAYWILRTTGTTTATSSFGISPPIARIDSIAYDIAGNGRGYDGGFVWLCVSWENTSQTSILIERVGNWAAASGKELNIEGFYRI